MAVDCIDVLSTTAVYLEGGLPGSAVVMVGGGAGVLAILGGWALRSLDGSAAEVGVSGVAGGNLKG